MLNELLKCEISLLRGECSRSKHIYEEAMSRCNAVTIQSAEDILQMEIDYSIEKVKSIECQLKSTTAILRRREKRLQFCKDSLRISYYC